MKYHAGQRGAAARLVAVVGFCALLNQIQAAAVPIGEITRGLPDVSLPKSSTDNLPVRYGLGFPIQLGPKTVGLFCNLRVIGPNRTDYEDGDDVFVFDDLRNVGKGGPTVVTRNEKEKDDKTGELRFIEKFPLNGGFWPLGAKQSDGSAHPGAGRGFAICQAFSFLGSGDKLTWDMFSQSTVKRYVEVLQLSFNGRRVSVVKRDLLKAGRMGTTSDGWGISNGGMQAAIPDGSDLLMAVMAADKAGLAKAGVARFRFTDGQWQPFTFTPVANGTEPSVVRRADRSLVFLARPDDVVEGDRIGKRILLWSSKDNGATWKQLLCAENERPRTPVSINATPDGRIFVLANVPGMTSPTQKWLWWHLDRVRLAMWQLADDAAAFEPPQPRIIRDAQEEFGLIDDYRWDLDHPSSGIVRLGDGKWHGLATYRIRTFSIQGDPVGEKITPQTGCYMEEVPSAQPAVPPWRF
jgi:hypothetical protein